MSITKQEKLIRLTMLRNMLNKHDKLFPKKLKFNMDAWFRGKYNLANQTTNRDCGTAACGLGSACCYAPFQKKGLVFFEDVDSDGKFSPTPAYKGTEGYEAGAKFFGIDLTDSYWLFSPQKYTQKIIMPSYVANRVQVIIDNLN